jgi:transposase
MEEVKSFKETGGYKNIAFAYESTGTYLLPLVRYMKEQGAEVIQVSPKHVKRLKELPDNSPGKTDKKDPRVIALVAESNAGLQAILPTGKYAELRQYVQCREQLKEDQTRCSNRLEAILAEYFPEYLQVMKGLKGETSRYVLQHYSTPEKILELGLKELTKEIKQVSRSKLQEDRAEQLYEAAEKTIGVTEGIVASEARVQILLDQYNLIVNKIRDVTTRMIEICQTIEYARYMASVKGIGWMTVAYLLGELTDPRNYRKYRQIEKVSGLNLYEISSGIRRGQKRITKRGREVVRKMLYLAALRMVRKGSIYHDDYQKMLDRGKSKTGALVAISKRILKLLHALARDEQNYDPKKHKKTKTKEIVINELAKCG